MKLGSLVKIHPIDHLSREFRGELGTLLDLEIHNYLSEKFYYAKVMLLSGKIIFTSQNSLEFIS